ncbi:MULTISPECIES: GH25 family lysozyme [Prevotellaceae]|uniref:GH25 family lysozyme n=1 Tax=Prevotellaceae TaxID=171552 RepID=UPI0003D38D61|nr:GH25 family lysozyme [Prevotella phocaeensis]ETD18823.1 hypothetical protein HMPREF1199_01643 [Hoylesella oralis CC98A]
MKRTFYFLRLLPVALFFCACNEIEHPQQTIVKAGAYCYQGGYSNGKYNGYGRLKYKDSVIYEGEWKDGLRYGHGICTDREGHRIVGTWQADTLIGGIRTDSAGIYRGDFERNCTASGTGTYTAFDGEYYEGHWKDNMRTGFGFSVAPGAYLRLGEWYHNIYKGERLEYTTERIYGIDISRFQHEKGRKRFTIRWDNIRITHLGTISNKRVNGTVDYPVSFCYIKSTEGITVKNRYYHADYAAARHKNIRCGAYHFFSTTSDAAAQARFFLKNSRFLAGDLPPVLDVEPSPRQIRKMGGTAVLFTSVRTWLRIVRRHTGVRPVLYISQSFVNKHLPEAPDIIRDYNIWIARYGEYKPNVHLVYWQLCPDGRVSGIHGEVDISVFNGYHSRFNEFLQTECIGSGNRTTETKN